jgi:hypothetical protein
MKRLGLTSGRPSLSILAKKAYEEIFDSDPAHTQPLRKLFPADGEVGACKQHRRSVAKA